MSRVRECVGSGRSRAGVALIVERSPARTSGNGARSRMIVTGTNIAVRKGCRWGMLLGLLLGITTGCSQSQERLDGEWVASQPPDTVIAVAPALNFSGNAQFDPVQVADLMASELSELPQIGVIGVSRVLAVLAEQGVERIQSPEHALQVCENLGAVSYTHLRAHET